MTDPTLRLLASLPGAEPDSARAAHLRATCRAALARSRTRPSPSPSGRTGVWEPLLVGLGGLYFAETIRLALHLAGIL